MIKILNSLIEGVSDNFNNKMLFEKALECLQNEILGVCDELVQSICYIVIKKDVITIHGIENTYVETSLKKCIKDRNWHPLEEDIYRMIIDDYFFVYKKVKFDKDTRSLTGFLLSKTEELELKLIRTQSQFIQNKLKKSNDIKYMSLTNSISL